LGGPRLGQQRALKTYENFGVGKSLMSRGSLRWFGNVQTHDDDYRIIEY
jgi:hypothetical protein